MTREELIEAARHCASIKAQCYGCPLYERYSGQAICMDILITALADKLENKPEPVNYTGDGYADGELVYDMAECPNCGWVYFEDESGWGEPCCSKCGTRLDWGEQHD